MDSQKNQERANFDPSEMLTLLFKVLTSKEEDVLRRRHGLSGTRKQTLEAIGTLYDVTRERIRQIESAAIRKIKSHPQFHPTVKPARHTIVLVLREEGAGIMEQELLLRKLLNFTPRTDENIKSLLFLLEHLIDEVELVNASEHLKRGWKLTTTSLELVHELLECLKEIVATAERPVSMQELWDQFTKHEVGSHHASRMDSDILASHVTLSRKLGRNPFGEFGLSEWGEIIPKRMNDKIYLILKRAGKPMHFHEIADQINKAKFDQRNAYPPTVHNELILNDRYVLVGRGVYALSEWGYRPGVVADVIADLLRDHPEGVTREQITEHVLKQRFVKKNTIYLALTNHDQFEKRGKVFVLRSEKS